MAAPTQNGLSERESFAGGWTGRLAAGTVLYIVAAVALLKVETTPGSFLDIANLFSDSPVSLAATVLAIAAARTSTDRVSRRIWLLFSLSLGLYTVGNIINSVYWLAGKDPFPSVGDIFYLSFYPPAFAAAVIAMRAGDVRVPWGKLTLDSSIITLGFGGFFWYFVIRPAADAGDPDHFKYALTQTYIAMNSVMVMAFGVLLMNGATGPLRRRTVVLLSAGFSTMFIADIAWALAKISGSYIPGSVSDAIYLSCYAGLVVAAREHIRGRNGSQQKHPLLDTAMAQGLPYLAMIVSFLVLASFTRGNPADPATAMTLIFFVLTVLVLIRQGVVLRDDAALREQRAAGRVEARFASLIRNAADVILITDVDGRLRFASPAAERVFGLHPEDIAGRNVQEFWSQTNKQRFADFLAEIEATSGQTVGPLEIAVKTGERIFTLESLGSNLLKDPAVAGIALNFRDVSERKALEEQLRQLAFHDPLTLLANRSLFRDRVDHALALAQRAGHDIAVLFLDLDNFKNVNDTLGHNVGDRLLQAAAQRLVTCTRATDTVARLGGDEFAILIEGVQDRGAVEQLAALITRNLGEPLLVDGNAVQVATSIGVAFPTGGDTPEQLLRNADIAMYGAKTAGKGCHIVFQSSMQERIKERLRLEDELRGALARRELFLEYQPIIDLKNRELLGVEALVRWNHPRHGRMAPGSFIPVAEESTLIADIGRWVLDESCCAVSGWRAMLPAGDGLRVSVNISGRHLQHGDLVADVRAALERSRLDAGSLVIELTESTMMQNTDVNLTRLRELRDVGVRLAIDDFGTGYSSLSYLHRFPIDILKIDRSFVTRLTEVGDGSELARAVVMLGDTLGLETVAEGIEQEDQADELLALGCVAGQGFLFERPTSLATVATSVYAARRAELRGTDTDRMRLTATGRFPMASRL